MDLKKKYNQPVLTFKTHDPDCEPMTNLIEGKP